MDREQAIEIIERHIDNNIASGSLVEQALRMAIEALKQPVATDTNVGDLISRQAVIDALMDAVKKVGVLDADDIKAVFDMLPTIQPERQKGEWIEISSINHTYKCSKCGRLLVNVTDGKNNVSKHYPYCHCGADMRGEQE